MDNEQNQAELSWGEALSATYDTPVEVTDENEPVKAPTNEPDTENEQKPVSEPSVDDSAENQANTAKDEPVEQNEPEKQAETPIEQPKTERQPFYKQQMEFERERTELVNDVLDKMGVQDKIIEGGEEIKDYRQLLEFMNPQTGEAFTEEEAAAWYLQRTQNLHTANEQARAQAQQIADQYIGLKNGSVRTMEKYGKFLNNNLELKKQLAMEYDKTLTKTDDNSIILKAPIDVEEFYDFMLKPYLELEETRNRLAELEKNKELADAEKRNQIENADRGDIIDRAGVTSKNESLDDWTKAQLEYYNNR